MGALTVFHKSFTFLFQILVKLATGKKNLTVAEETVSSTSDVLGQQRTTFLLYNQEHTMYDSADAGF